MTGGLTLPYYGQWTATKFEIPWRCSGNPGKTGGSPFEGQLRNSARDNRPHCSSWGVCAAGTRHRASSSADAEWALEHDTAASIPSRPPSESSRSGFHLNERSLP